MTTKPGTTKPPRTLRGILHRGASMIVRRWSDEIERLSEALGEAPDAAYWRKHYFDVVCKLSEATEGLKSERERKRGDPTHDVAALKAEISRLETEAETLRSSAKSINEAFDNLAADVHCLMDQGGIPRGASVQARVRALVVQSGEKDTSAEIARSELRALMNDVHALMDQAQVPRGGSVIERLRALVAQRRAVIEACLHALDRLNAVESTVLRVLRAMGYDVNVVSEAARSFRATVGVDAVTGTSTGDAIRDVMRLVLRRETET